jgi:hypothetical protein
MIYLECDADQALAESLGVRNKNIEHCHGRGNVCNKLKGIKRKVSDSIGMIDEDPGSAPDKYLENIKEINNKNGIKTFKDTNNNKLIVICPYLEAWIIKQAKASKINPKTYNLPDKPNELHREAIHKLNKFKDLIKDLITNKSTGIIYLKGLLK